jgi:hypothetical protein
MVMSVPMDGPRGCCIRCGGVELHRFSEPAERLFPTRPGQFALPVFDIARLAPGAERPADSLAAAFQ